jgi:hypothetical protein
LYIISASVLRIYLPILDDPSWFQMLYSIDHRAFSQGRSKGTGTIWVPDAKIIKAAAGAALKSDKRLPQSAREKLESIDTEEMDLVMWFGNDGAIAVRSILVS